LTGLWLRSLAFNAAFWLWTVAAALGMLPLLAGSGHTIQRAARLWMRGIQGLLRTVVGLDHEVRGRGRVPAGPAIFAVKHQSAWETMALHLLLDEPAIALKRELLQIPLFGWYAWKAGMIRIDRGQGSKALRLLVQDARARLDAGRPVVIFPEGTRVAPGVRQRYLPGVAALYLQLRVPVVPVALNSGLFWGRRSFVKRPGRIVVEFLDPIPPGLDRRTFLAELEARLEPAAERLAAEGQEHLQAT